jgi:hypothetical protein
MEPVLYADVTIDSWNGLHMFKERIALDTTPGATQRPVGHLVLSLRISNFSVVDMTWPPSDVASQISDFMSAVTVILSHVTCLQKFEDRMIDDWYRKQSHILCLSHIVTCRSVTILISWKEASVLALLNRLVNLTELHVTIPRGGQVDVRDQKFIQPLLLPKIKSFVWVVFGEAVLPSIITFLSRCRFGSHCFITLQMKGLTPLLALILTPLFTENQVLLLDLIHTTTEVQANLAPSLAHIIRLDITDSPPATEIAHLTQSLRHLRVTCSSDDPDSNDGQQFWAFMKELEAGVFTSPSSCTLRIMRENSQIFSWAGGENGRDYAAFIGKLLPIAARLSKRNIRILDCHSAEYTALAKFV